MSFNVLAVAAHFDDAELGCAGALARHARRGDRVWLYVATTSGYADMKNRPVRTAETARAEGRRAARALGVRLIAGSFPTFGLSYDDELIRAVRVIVEDKRIDTVYLPWTGDAHQDHRALARAAITAARHCPRLLMYRINSYDTEETFSPRHFVDTSSTMPVKLRALRCHRSEHRRTGNRWLRYVEAEDRNCGLKLGVRYAEAFQAVRYLAP
ncbi:MAG: PIG-L family deacetylase [Elusimicrobia bacterium]|nr:PIG-L family deacetylase [Elusimicrobiota bacterium]